MTATLLSSELSTLISDSKRKNPDLRNAAERSLQELRSLPATSEQQIAAGKTGVCMNPTNGTLTDTRPQPTSRLR